MASGYEPISNTNWGRSHAKTWMVGDRADNTAPGDTAGAGQTDRPVRVQATHTRTLGGIADLVGNVWGGRTDCCCKMGALRFSATTQLAGRS